MAIFLIACETLTILGHVDTVIRSDIAEHAFNISGAQHTLNITGDHNETVDENDVGSIPSQPDNYMLGMRNTNKKEEESQGQAILLLLFLQVSF